MKKDMMLFLVVITIIIIGFSIFLTTIPTEISKEEAEILEQFKNADKVEVIVRLEENREIGSYSNNKEYYDNLAGEIANSMPSEMEFDGLLTMGFSAKITLNGFFNLKHNQNVKSIILNKPMRIE